MLLIVEIHIFRGVRTVTKSIDGVTALRTSDLVGLGCDVVCIRQSPLVVADRRQRRRSSAALTFGTLF